MHALLLSAALGLATPTAPARQAPGTLPDASVEAPVVSVVLSDRSRDWTAFAARHAGSPALAGLRVLRVNRLGVHDLAITGGEALEARVAALSALEGVELAFAPGRGEWLELPGDPQFAQQWHLDNLGIGGAVAGADVSAEEAWSVTTGDPSVVVAILDSGVSITHPDLAPNVWHNPLELPNGIDDDNNGLVDDLDGWDFYNDDGDVTGPFFHGTRVAGMVAARSDDGFGVASLAGGWGTTPGCSVMAIGVGDSFPQASVLDDAILYAVDQGARVINLSLTVPADPALDMAIDDAVANGVLVVAAAGNSSTAVAYPANDPDVVAIAATTDADTAASFSNFGPQIVLSAPGDGVWTTSGTASFASGVGTSFASPLVCAAAGLLFSRMPSLTSDEALAILVATADDIDAPGPDTHTGAGRLNAGAALALLDASDCNGNGIYDPREVADGTVSDANGDGVPDLCQLGTPLCFGDGSAAACPCGNSAAAGEGCANSSGVGARLTASGSPVLADEDLVLQVSGGRAGQPGVFLRGLASLSLPFKDGVLCVGNPTERLEVGFLDASGAVASSPDVESFEQLMPGQTATYQFWYRDPDVSPCGSGSNFSSAFAVDWL